MEKPDFIFELSWEVCNMVGGIHTVIQSKASQIRDRFGDDYVCVGPHVPHPITAAPAFREEIWSDVVYKLIQDFSDQGVTCLMGRWNIPGNTKVLLVGFNELFHKKDRILAHYWERYGVDSLFGGYDYTEPVLFAHAVSLLIEQISNRLLLSEGKRVLVHAHEWMSAIALLHLKESCPDISTVFTTHATMLGRTLSSHDHEKTLDYYISRKSAAAWAQETNVESKHSVEVIGAREADCFSTVSETTSDECTLILGKKADIVVHNGLSDDIPSSDLLEADLRKKMRLRMLQIAQEVTGFNYDSNQTFMMVTSGRYEFRNKGVDLFIDSTLDLRESLHNQDPRKKVLAFVMCPAGHGARIFPRAENAFSTHTIADPTHDPLLDLLNRRGQVNSAANPVHVIFLPLYLNGTENTIPETYWELICGIDLGIFASWYEPWGYTPHETVALGIPTFTTDCSGFGRWVQSLPGSAKEKGVVVLNRAHTGTITHSYDELRMGLKKEMLEILNTSPEDRLKWSEGALRTAKHARWGDLIEGYLQAYSFAIERTNLRVSKSPIARFRSFSQGNVVAPSRFSHARANVKKFSVTTRFPNVQKSLRRFMSGTMSWKWNPYVLHLFYHLDRKLWEEVDQEPIKFISNADDETVKKISTNPELKKMFNEIKVGFEANTLASANALSEYDRAYFCMEYGITDQLRIYSGGLGTLAGDHLKTASDMNIPLAAFGLFYQYGYFRQVLNPDGHQMANYDRSEVEKLEINLVQDLSGGRLLLSIPFIEKEIYFQIWRLDLHGVDLFLLDSNVMENPVGLRNVSDRLYSTEQGKRIIQEWFLSMGGLELIKKLGLKINVFHMNEGHTAFLVVGRILDLMDQHHLSFDEAFDYVRFTTIFTTHTPVAAGHDEFPPDEAMRLLKCRIDNQAILDRVMHLGTSLKGVGDDKFSMTGLALRGSRWVNAVSKIHESVSQRMFNNLFPDLDEDEVPITHVTNGVHVPYWLEATWQDLFFEVLGDQWPKRLKDVDFWLQLGKLSLERVAEKKLILKGRLISWIRKRLVEQIQRGVVRPEYADILARLDENTLIITHAKRMTPYKRADFLFEEPDRLAGIIQKSPVQILFIYAGKAHPADVLGQEVLQRISEWSRDPRFRGSILVLEDYDLSYARRLLSGSDVWLNTPLRPLEASGTSGMKAAINGTLHFSVADGWWPEAYNGRNGWMIGDGSELWDKALQDAHDRERIFSLLENEILRDYVKSDGQTFSPAWIKRVRESIYTILPFVTTERMLTDYQQRLYQPALRAANDLKQNNFAELRKLTSFKKTLLEHWHSVIFENVESEGLETDNIPRSRPAEVVVELSHPNLSVEHVRVQAILSHQATALKEVERQIIACECISTNSGSHTKWRLRLENRSAGDFSLAFRAIARPYSNFEDAGFELKLVKWM